MFPTAWRVVYFTICRAIWHLAQDIIHALTCTLYATQDFVLVRCALVCIGFAKPLTSNMGTRENAGKDMDMESFANVNRTMWV